MASVSSFLLLGYVLGAATSAMAGPLDRAPALGFDSPVALRQTKRMVAADQITQRLTGGTEDSQASDEDDDQRGPRSTILVPTANENLPANKRWVAVLAAGNSLPGQLQPRLLSARGPPVGRAVLSFFSTRSSSLSPVLAIFTRIAANKSVAHSPERKSFL